VQNTGAARSVDAAAKKPRPIWEKSFGPEHPNIAAGLNNLALLLQTMNRLAEAEPLMRRALALDEKSYSPSIPMSLPTSTTSPNCCRPRTG
jgi:hypothetical protein